MQRRGVILGISRSKCSLALDPAKFSVNTDFVGVGGSSLNDVFSTANLGLNSWLEGAIKFIDGLIATVESDALEGLPLLGQIDLPEAGFLHQLRDVFVTLGNYDTPQACWTTSPAISKPHSRFLWRR